MNQAEAARNLLRQLLPAGFGCAALPLSHPAPALLPPEAACIRGAVPKRRQEFALGRHVLRLALAEAGHDLPPDRPIPMRGDRRPDLPQGVRASLSHGGDLCVAIAAPLGGPSVGVDVESALSPPEGLAEAVAPYRMATEDPLLVFCVKEAIFKAQYAVTGRMLDFGDLALSIRGTRARARLCDRIIGARFGRVGGHHLAVSLWGG